MTNKMHKIAFYSHNLSQKKEKNSKIGKLNIVKAPFSHSYVFCYYTKKLDSDNNFMCITHALII